MTAIGKLIQVFHRDPALFEMNFRRVADASDEVPSESGHRVEPRASEARVGEDDRLAGAGNNEGQVAQELLLRLPVTEFAPRVYTVVQGQRAAVAAQLRTQDVVLRIELRPIEDD